ncbi:unnamed protein product, partial [Didymodactylos carnosus]
TSVEEAFTLFEQDDNKNVLIIVIDGKIGQQRAHISFVRQLVDRTEYNHNILEKSLQQAISAAPVNNRQGNFAMFHRHQQQQPVTQKKRFIRKYFIMLLHSPAQELYHHSCYPSIFLHDWDFYFFDTSKAGNSFHLKKILELLCASYHQSDTDNTDVLCDLNVLFDESLWSFCSRLQFILQDLSPNAFENQYARDFYARHTSIAKRVHCLKQIMKSCTELQQRIVNAYHERLSKNNHKLYNIIYQTAKQILCGQRFEGLVDSIQTQVQSTFTNFVANILRSVVNDYGLDILSQTSSKNDEMRSKKSSRGYEIMLNLIDYSSFGDDSLDLGTSAPNQDLFQIITHYSCVPLTPLYHLFHQRIKTHADDIKLATLLKLNQESGINEKNMNNEDYNRVTTNENDYFIDENLNVNEIFRNELCRAVVNDNILKDIINELKQRLINTYSQDLVRTFCTIVEAIDVDIEKCSKTIEFISQWLQLLDENERNEYSNSIHKDVWLLCHVYTSFEYDRNDLLSLYSACRILDQLNPNQDYRSIIADEVGINADNNSHGRSQFRENIFRLMFDCLWSKLCHLCEIKDELSLMTWIQTYTFISKYYPSQNVLHCVQLQTIRFKIDFMHLSYLILMNEKTPTPIVLVAYLLNENAIDVGPNSCLSILSSIIELINEYFDEKNCNCSTLMIDVQQWIISILKTTSIDDVQEQIDYLLKYLNETRQLQLPMKQFLFDQLANIIMEQKQKKLREHKKPRADTLSLIKVLLPFVVQRLPDKITKDFQYVLPYHPFVITNADDRDEYTLIDLFFFHIRNRLDDEVIKYEFLNNIMLLKPTTSTIKKKSLVAVVENLYRLIKDYLLIRGTALLLCDEKYDEYSAQCCRLIQSIIQTYLPFDQQQNRLTDNMKLFLSTIIMKRSWNYLLNMLKLEFFQRVNDTWSTHLCHLLEIRQNPQQNNYLQLCDQLQFTLSSNVDETTIFPKLHQPYKNLSQIFDVCVQDNTQQRWNPLAEWIQVQLNSNPPLLELNEIKTLLLLKIYYNYYCNNQLALLNMLLETIDNALQLSTEEMRVFRAILKPEQFMIGYNILMEAEKNFLYELFQLNAKCSDELSIRHSLINLMAMILLGGKNNFLWSFAFQPLSLENTFGFGSTAQQVIRANGVHYDCGCILTENGDLLQFANKGTAQSLNVPAVYVAYFATFGAMVWHLLLFENSVANLYGPILAKHAVDNTDVVCRIAGHTERTRVCHFVRARLFASMDHLSIRSNREDASIILNRCFEQFAFLTLNQVQNSWIKPLYVKLDEELKAEQEFQSLVFYRVHQQLPSYKAYINNLRLQSEIQLNLQQFVSNIPLHVQYPHFIIELHNPQNVNLSLTILH